jgi:hypothetical protein
MTRQRSFLLVASFALSVVLIAILIKVGKIDLRVTLQQLENVRWISFAKLILLNALLVLISTEKWRSIDAALRRSSDSVQSRSTSFALTSAGLALGTFLPVQLAMATTRTLGTYVHGSAIKRGTAGTLYEQSFDLLTVAFLAIASGITRIWGGGGVMWTISAVLMTALALATVGPCVRPIRWLAATCARATAPESRLGALLRNLSDLLHSGLLGAGLTRRLVLLSAARFVVVVLMSIQTVEAIGLHIPLWHMAAAIPFVVIVSVVGLTPGGLGINELTCAASLSFFGTPLAIGAQWALANRVLVAVSYLVVAGFAIAVLLVGKMIPSSARDVVRER